MGSIFGAPGQGFSIDYDAPAGDVLMVANR